MARKGLSAILALLVASISLSGCIGQFGGDSDLNDSKDGDSSSDLEYTEDGIFTCIEHGNLTRCWQTHVPEYLDQSSPVPLVVDMHGYSSHSTEQRQMSSFETLANEEDLIVVYPDGDGEVDKLTGETNQAWNAGWCCSHSVNEEIDDVGFIEKMIQIVIQKYNIDTNRIYASGWSNGCAMSQRLAMESSDIFAAVGCMSMYLLTEHTDNYSPIPIMEVHGFLDQVVLYESTALSVPWNKNMWKNPEAYETGAIENIFEWSELNNCTGGIETFDTNPLYTIQGFSNCEDDAQIRLMTIYAAQHNPYANNPIQDDLIVFQGTQGLVQSSEIVWDFISQFSKEDVESSN